jgi:hypothetical protein
MFEASNKVVMTQLADGLSLTATDASGHIDKQGMSFLPPLPPELKNWVTGAVAKDGTITLTELSWMTDLGVDKSGYDIVFDQASMTIKAFRPGTSQADPKNLIFQAVYDNDKKVWDDKFEINFVVEAAKPNCEPTDFRSKWNGKYYVVNKDDRTGFFLYMAELGEQYKKIFTNSESIPGVKIFASIDPTNNCWGLIIIDYNRIIYRQKDGAVKQANLMAGWYDSIRNP